MNMDKQNNKNQFGSNNDTYKKADNINDGIYAAIGKHESRLDKMESHLKTLLSDNQKMRQYIVHMEKQIQSHKDSITRLEEKWKQEEKRHQEEKKRSAIEKKSRVVTNPVSNKGAVTTSNNFKTKGSQSSVICPNCGKAVDVGNKFCTNCGSLMTTSKTTGQISSVSDRTPNQQNSIAQKQSRTALNNQTKQPAQEQNLNANFVQQKDNHSHQSVSQQGRFCPNCHAEISTEDQFCIYCGTSLKGVNKNRQLEKPQAETSILQIPVGFEEEPIMPNPAQSRIRNNNPSMGNQQFQSSNSIGNRKNICPSCGAKIVPGNLFCTECGSRID